MCFVFLASHARVRCIALLVAMCALRGASFYLATVAGAKNKISGVAIAAIREEKQGRGAEAYGRRFDSSTALGFFKRDSRELSTNWKRSSEA